MVKDKKCSEAAEDQMLVRVPHEGCREGVSRGKMAVDWVRDVEV